jgi:hypothetical protein
MSAAAPRTIVEKIWTDHVVTQDPGAPGFQPVDVGTAVDHCVFAGSPGDSLGSSGQRPRTDPRNSTHCRGRPSVRNDGW